MGLALDEPRNDEVTTKVSSLDVLISDEVRIFADQSVLDYTNSWLGEGFTISSGRSGC